MKVISSVIVLTFLFTAACAQKKKSGDLVEAKAPETTQEPSIADKNLADKSYKCTVNKDTRLVEFDKSTKRCEIHYTKFGEKMQVAWAESTPSICSDVFDKIRTNIESKGFKCQSLSEETAEEKAPAKTEAKRESASIKQ